MGTVCWDTETNNHEETIMRNRVIKALEIMEGTKNTNLDVRLPDSLKNVFAEEAKKMGTSSSKLTRQLIIEFLEKRSAMQ